MPRGLRRTTDSRPPGACCLAHRRAADGAGSSRRRSRTEGRRPMSPVPERLPARLQAGTEWRCWRRTDSSAFDGRAYAIDRVITSRVLCSCRSRLPCPSRLGNRHTQPVGAPHARQDGFRQTQQPAFRQPTFELVNMRLASFRTRSQTDRLTKGRRRRSPRDPRQRFGPLLVVVSVAACFLPARKAANLDPLAVLRYD